MRSARVNLRFLPTENFEINLIVDGLVDRSSAPADTLVAMNTSTTVTDGDGGFLSPFQAQVPNWNAEINIPNFGILRGMSNS